MEEHNLVNFEGLYDIMVQLDRVNGLRKILKESEILNEEELKFFIEKFKESLKVLRGAIVENEVHF